MRSNDECGAQSRDFLSKLAFVVWQRTRLYKCLDLDFIAIADLDPECRHVNQTCWPPRLPDLLSIRAREARRHGRAAAELWGLGARPPAIEIGRGPR